MYIAIPGSRFPAPGVEQRLACAAVARKGQSRSRAPLYSFNIVRSPAAELWPEHAFPTNACPYNAYTGKCVHNERNLYHLITAYFLPAYSDPLGSTVPFD